MLQKTPDFPPSSATFWAQGSVDRGKTAGFHELQLLSLQLMLQGTFIGEHTKVSLCLL